MNEVYLGRGKDRHLLPLGKLLGEGATGRFHAIPALPGAAAKLYHDAEEAALHEARIEALIAAPPALPAAEHEGMRYPQIAWPQAKLFDRSGRFIGYLKPEIDFDITTNLADLLDDQARRRAWVSSYYGYRVLVARNLASVIAELHRAGHHMIDLRPEKLRFYRATWWIAVAHADGFSTAHKRERTPADQLSEDYVAPESWARPIAQLGAEQDLFALAIILFQLLNNGIHPFASGPTRKRGQPTDIQTRILDGLYGYALHPRRGAEPAAASLHTMFRRDTREMFDAAFVPGRQRPTAEAWRDHLDRLVEQMIPCDARPDEHVQFGQGCALCEVEAGGAVARPRLRQPSGRKMPQLPAPAPARTLNVRPIPMLPATPMMVQKRPPRRRRIGWAGWQSLAAVVVLAGIGFATQNQWRPLLAAPEVSAQAAATAAPSPELPEARIAHFSDPRDFLIVPTGGTLSIALHRGPGDDFPVLDRLSLQDAVVGRGTARGSDGSAWLYVVRDGDGMAGFVPMSSVIERRASGEPIDLSAPADATMLAKKYSSLLASTTGYDRAYLSETQQLWEEGRRHCDSEPDPTACRLRADEARLAELEAWSRTAKQVRDRLPPAASALSSPDEQR